MPDRILLVDDEQAVLDALRRQHRGVYSMVAACGVEAGLAAIADEGPFAAVVSDFQMPVMNGTQFLARVRDLDPDMIRVMLTGQADLTTAIEAVNRGHIFRFLTKPCAPDVFRGGIDAALEQYHLRNAEHVLLEQTVKGSIEVMTDVLALANPVAFGRANRIRGFVRHIVGVLGIDNGWQHETAALLSQIGCVAIPNDVILRLESGKSLTPHQEQMMASHPRLARDILRKIPRLQTVAEIVHHQRSPQSKVLEEAGEAVALGSRILSAALNFEELLSLGATRKQALDAMQKEAHNYGQRILDALATAQAHSREENIRLVPIEHLQVGMILEEDVRNAQDNLLVASGHVITLGSLQRLRNYAELDLLEKQEFRVGIHPADGGAGSAAA